MHRVDTQTTLANIITDLAESELAEPQNDARLASHLDAYIGTGSDHDIIARSRRVFDLAMQLPPTRDAMRTRVARSLVADACRRSPNMAQARAHVMRYTDPLASRRAEVSRALEATRALSPTQFEAREAAMLRAVAAVCPTERLIYGIVTHIPASCLDALQEGDADMDAIAQGILAHFDEVIGACTSQISVPPFTAEERTLLPHVTAFMQATGYMAGLTYPEPAQTAILRLIMTHSTAEQLDRLATLYRSPEGDCVRRAKPILEKDEERAMREAMAARPPYRQRKLLW